jgi:hypothetical protein
MNGQVFAPSMPIAQQFIPNRPKDWFVYPNLFTVLAGSTNASLTFQIDAASDFYLTQLTYLSEIDSTSPQTISTFVVPKVTLQVTDGGSNRNLFQAQTPLYSVAGDGSHPHKLLHPRLFARNSAITLTVVNYSTATTYARLYINFEGFRIYQ